MLFTLQRYLIRTSFFLRDTSQKFFGNPQLTACINQARADICYDTGCSRAYATFNAIPGQEKYDYATFVLPSVLNAGYPADSIAYCTGISAELNPTLRYKLNYMVFESFDAYYRTLPYGFLPGIWTAFDDFSFYLAPIPNAAYVIHADVVYLPVDMTQNTDSERALPPFLADLVAIKAASWAKYYERNWPEVDNFIKLYTLELNKRFGLRPSHRVPSYYDENPVNP